MRDEACVEGVHVAVVVLARLVAQHVEVLQGGRVGKKATASSAQGPWRLMRCFCADVLHLGGCCRNERSVAPLLEVSRLRYTDQANCKGHVSEVSMWLC
jgi:hypothetical protein